MSTFEGRVWKFGDDVNTDLIIPGRYLDNYDPAHLAAHAMEGVSREFASRVARGDIVVAGKNFGCGSSREQAVIALKRAGIGVVIASSFARIFYRNAVNLGLPVLVSKDACVKIGDGDTARVDIVLGTISTSEGALSVTTEPTPEHVARILEQGGLVPYIKARLGTK
jgi:3-isopropylmalate dehydratase small subunit